MVDVGWCSVASRLHQTFQEQRFDSSGIAALSESGFHIISFRGNDEQKFAKDGAFTSSEGVNVRSWQRRSTVLVTAFLDTTTAQKLSCSDSNGSKGFRAYARSPATRLLVYELLAPASLTLHSAYLDIFETVGQYEVQRFVIAVMRGARSGGVSRRPEGTGLVEEAPGQDYNEEVCNPSVAPKTCH